MDWALGLGLYLLGVISGALVCLAIMSDKPRHAEMYSEPDNIETRRRRAF